jgi:hypothetical protein
MLEGVVSIFLLSPLLSKLNFMLHISTMILIKFMKSQKNLRKQSLA